VIVSILKIILQVIGLELIKELAAKVLTWGLAKVKRSSV